MSKYKAPIPTRANTGSSIRGKISGPIPIPDDEEFPIRSPGTGIATPLGSEGIEKQLRVPTTGIAVSDFSETRAPSIQRSYNEGPMPPRHMLQTTLRNSQISVSGGGSSIEKPQKKKTTLKSVLGKLFGNKKEKNRRSTTSTARDSNIPRAGQHRSDPSALNRETSHALSQKRSASLPINEYNRALRSHSPFTETFPLQNPSDLSRQNSSTLAERRARTRRATTPSRLYEPSPAGNPDNVNGLAPRPASSHARDSRLFSDDEGRSAIGCAVTSGSHPNRRSRSLDGLRAAALAQVQSGSRRRSDDIRYWRQSYDIDALSPMSSPKIEKELQDVTQHGEPEAGEMGGGSEEQIAPQPFNFGPMGELAGMKITEAASLETRVSRMEKRMNQMEKMILQIQSIPASGVNSKGPNSVSRIFPRPAADESSVYSFPRHVDRFRAKESDQRSSRTTSSRDTQQSAIESNTTRPLSTATVRGVPPPVSSDTEVSQLTGERYNKLVSFISSEQEARLRLETIVDRLQVQLHEQIRIQSSRPTSLATHHPNVPLQHSRAGGPEPYPTPSPEHHQLTRLSPRAPQSAFEADDSDSSDDDGHDFQTPSEEMRHYDMNPEEDYAVDIDEDDDADERDGKRAVRITSLSQLTLGKGRGMQAVNF